jgi:hypothetical protein
LHKRGHPPVDLPGFRKVREVDIVNVADLLVLGWKIQELHLPVYHALCSMVEAELFEPRRSA